jgi:hypothetical protein
MECKNREDQQACVPFFVHENTMMHYNKANKRMLIALIVVCIAGLIGICIFVHGNTVREKQLIALLDKRIVEVASGVHEQPDP